MRIKQLIGALAFSGILAAGVAYAAATSASTSAPAPLAEAESAAFTSTWVALSDNEAAGEMTQTGLTATYSMGATLKFQDQTICNTNDDGEGSSPEGKLGFAISRFQLPSGTTPSDGSELLFTLTPDAGYSVTPQRIVFDIANLGYGDGRFAVYVNGKEIKGTTDPGRSNDWDKNNSAWKQNGKVRSAYTQSVDLSSVGTSSEPVVVSIKLFHRNAQTDYNRKMGVANVVISGTVAEEGATPVDPDKPQVPAEYASWDIIGDGTVQFKPNTEGGQWSYSGTRYELSNCADPHVAYIKNNTSASVQFYCAKAGVYSATFNVCSASNPATVTYAIKNAQGLVETSVVMPYNKEKGDVEVNFPDQLSVGPKTLTVSFAADHTGFICNFHAPSFTWVEEGVASEVPAGYAPVPGELPISEAFWTLDGLKIEANNPANFGYASNNAGASARMYVKEEGNYSVHFNFNWFQNEGDLEIEVLNEAGETEIAKQLYHITGKHEADILLNGTLTVGPKTFKTYFRNIAGGYCANFIAPVFTKVEIGEGTVVGLTVDGRQADAAVVEALNADGAAAISDMVFTAVPAVKATFDNGSAVEAAVKVENGTAVATFAHPVLAEKSFTLNIEGLHIYTAADTDKAVKIVYDAALNQADGSWSNGLYTIRNCNDGWGGTQFKFKPGTHTLEVPSNVIVKQVKFAQLFDNYDPGKVVSVTSEGAKSFMPTVSDFVQGSASAYDLVVNFENHQQGAPITFTLEGGQPVAWFELLVEEVRYEGEPTFKGGVHTATDVKNHAVVTLSFDRPMQDAVATYNGKEVKADGGKTTLKFSLWDLAWGAETVLTLPAGAAKDVDGNANTEAITYTVKVGAQPSTVDPVESVIYVTNVDELRAAVADVMATNNSAAAPRRVIILKDGDYDLGDDTYIGKNDKGEDAVMSPSTSSVCLHINKAYNVSLIGESRDGVVIKGTRTGISNPVFSTRYSTNIYMENLTIINELDYGKENRVGVGVAHYGGNRDVMVNVRLLSQQDTQVTGEQGYYYNCEIHGSVDYICGGGSHFYENCTFVQLGGGYITAPSTSAAMKYGYVFQNCTIKGVSGYYLGRPWQNKPAAHFLNTTMEATPAEAGWGGMGTLETRFYEFNSMDASGSALDLSKRANSPTSTNKYTPVLTAEEADEFTVENVLGGDDSWLATEELATDIAAPEGVAYEKEGNYIYWYPVDGAAGYMIYNNGQYVGYASGDCDHFDLATNEGYKKVQARAAEDYSYTIRAIAPNGTMSDHSFAMTPGNPTGIEAPEADNAAVEVRYYNLQGQPVEEGYRGAVIKVSVAADGTRTVSKILAD